MIGLLDTHISLMHGWVPLSVQLLAVITLVVGIGWRTRRWRLLWLPLAAVCGVLLASMVHRSIAGGGLSGDPVPRWLMAWVAVTGFAGAAAALGWRSATWRRRTASVLAVPMCALSAALVLNLWVGYFPTVQTAWGQLTGGPLPGQVDPATLARMIETRTVPASGVVVGTDVPDDTTTFKHRGELIYLPPAYFAVDSAALPVVMMIGGQFNTPADWIRAADAVATIDDFAARHSGNAPVFVFVDSGGAFNIDTECVNGTRGNAADHLTKGVVPYLVDTFGVSDHPANWGVVGWSSGGTCAVNLTVKYPELFSVFVDIDGDIAPNTGSRAQTVERLFGGEADAYDQWDPATVMNRHGPYRDVAGWFAVSSPPGPPQTPATGTPALAAHTLCRIGGDNGIDCAVVAQPGKHDWQFAAKAFAAALPWLAGRLGTPGVPEIALPGAADR